jgi:purine nucleosidase
MKFPQLDESVRIKNLTPLTKGRVDMVLDTDTFNEIDDQFALVYALLSPERVNVKAIIAAPFKNSRSIGPEEGMELSYDEILRLLERLGRSPKDFVYKGSRSYLPNEDTPCSSEGVDRIISLAREASEESPLYVVAIGAITNVASAILKDPEIIKKIVVVWLGGNALYWPHTWEFNLMQDVPAARVVFDSGVPVVQIPCQNVTTHLRTTVPELTTYLKGKGPVADFLYERFCEYSDNHRGWSKEIWDMAAIAWLINPEWAPSELVSSPILTDKMTWSVDRSRHLIRSVSMIHRDPIFIDFFDKIEALNS